MKRWSVALWPALMAALLLTSLAVGCGQEVESATVLEPVPGGDPSQGKEAIAEYGCGTCHVIPSISGANGHVGPPLTSWAKRHYIAGSLANTPDNLIRWIMNPEAVEPGTAMPNMAVTEQDARDIAAYLSTIK